MLIEKSLIVDTHYTVLTEAESELVPTTGGRKSMGETQKKQLIYEVKL